MANIDLITGFLGAGKTTFIGKYFKYLTQKGERVAVIENEYGNKGIDSMILRSHGVDTEELFGGCLCCTLKVGFHDMILRLAGHYDRIIVEPSGVYDISQFYAVASSPELKGKCSIGNVICIVDPNMLDTADDFSRSMLSEQIKASGCVLFSMNDNACRSKVKEYAEACSRILDITDFKYFCYNDLDSVYNCGASLYHGMSESTHSAKYLSTMIKCGECSKDEMTERLKRLFLDPGCGKVLRVKGVWNKTMINCIAASFEYKYCDAEEGINVIGLSLNRKRIKEILNC